MASPTVTVVTSAKESKNEYFILIYTGKKYLDESISGDQSRINKICLMMESFLFSTGKLFIQYIYRNN